MALYLCRWPNGDCSFVEASSKGAAIAALREAGNAEGCPITPMQDFMVHFALSNGGKLELQCFGEATEEAIFEIAYPVLGKALVDAPEEANTGVLTPEGEKLIREAVRKERERVREKKAKEPQTELRRKINAKTMRRPVD
jgi:hypothetical protein